MLESVLADILTRILGQYLEGIDRDSVRFGAWSGLVELRGVALRSEALAVLFETLGLDLPVTVDAGFIGLLRLQVPWKTIGTTSVQIHMEDITIVARPVRGDGSDNSELENRERRIKRAKLITDDAVREASWGVSTDEDNATSTSWSSWLLSDQLRAKIVDNIQIHLKDIILRFEDHFSNPQKPYIASVALKSLKAISVNELWTETFVERKGAEDTRKLLEIIGFRIDWAPITPESSPGPSKLAGHDSELSRFKTPQLLRQYLTEGSAETFAVSKKLLHEVDGSMRLRLSAAENYVNASQELREQDPAVDLDIRFPDVHIDLDDVQYASILQTSVYFARLSTRGVRPRTAKARWVWAINQLLPGFSTRRSRALRFSEKGIAEARDKRVLYVACRKSLLKARRNGLEEPKDMLEKLESIERELSFTEILAYRDRVDRIIELEKNEWSHVEPRKTETAAQSSEGTTTSSFWQMLGYSDDTAARQGEPKRPERKGIPASSEKSIDSNRLSLRIGFLLRGATLRLCQGGYPVDPLEKVALKLRRLHIGVLYAATGELVVESLVGGVEAWDLTQHVRMVYSRLFSEESQNSQDSTTAIASYPHDVSQAIETIRSGSNPARDVLLEETLSDGDQMVDLSRDKQIDPIYDQQSRELSFTASEESFERAPQSSRVSDTEKEDSFVPANITHRVTEAEFLGNPRDTAGSHKYIAAFRFTKQGRSSEKRDDSSLSHGTLEVSVATLEAVVDGPKGSFLWGLKFWKPKGMVRDPIMAFLGAAAGARIAELRIELEEALLANRVPMQINAVIMAPRFIIPGNSSSDPAFVVNMGTLGVCTSENSSRAPSSVESSSKLVRYSNYVLTLDDLGVYFCPGLSRAVSSDLSRKTSAIDPESQYDRMLIRRSLDTRDVERIIRPFSLRFVLQTLRDSSAVQVAHSSSDEKGSTASNIAKVRVRGTIPGLSVILTLKAFQHLAAAIQMWSEEVYSESDDGMQEPRHSHSKTSLPSELFDEDMGIPNSPTKILTNDENRMSGLHNHEDSENLLTAMASYDIKVLVQKVSLDVRQTNDMRLITTVADEMITNIVKTSSKNLVAEFSLGSLSVTDGSRGSTAAFRRLLYAGNLSGTKGVSPPRSLVDVHDESKPFYPERDNFVTFKYDLDLLSRDQKVFLRFLSLNMVCVRETYVRIGMFLSQVREYVKSQRKQRRTQANEAQYRHSSRSFLDAMTDVEKVVFVPGSSLLQKRLAITSEFAGFHLQLVASGGTVAVVEMQDSRVFFNRSKPLPTRLWGDFRFFSVQDLTATVDEHMAVVTYNRPSTLDHDFSAQFQESEGAPGPADEWSLTIPTTSGKAMSFKAAFRGIRITYLARFSDVIRQYMSVLVSELQPVIAGSMDGYEVIANDLKATAAVMPRLSTLVVLQDLVVRLPRHSNCNSEAVNIRLSRLELTDQPGARGQTEWVMNFLDLQMAVEYLLCDDIDLQSNMSISSTFLSGIEASLVVGQVEPLSVEGEFGNADENMCASLTLLSPVRVNLCEAQYTVLYFVLTENLAETVSGLDVSTGAPSSSDYPNKETETYSPTTNCKKNQYSENVPHSIAAPLAGQGTSTTEDLKTKDMIFKLFVPFLSTEISRGWDVAQESCKVIGLYMKDVRAKLRKSNPYRLLIELEGYLLGLLDLRAERGTGARAVAIPLVSEQSQYSTSNVSKGNLSLTYDKEGSERPSIVVYMTEFEFELSLSLFGDITYLAVPGWPFLRSSSFAPDLAYLGRTMNILLSESQIVLRANEFEGDCRAIVLTGEFLLKVDWKRLTGAKRVSIRSSQFEICTSTLQPRHRGLDYFGVEVLTAEKVKRSETPLAYPTDSFLEYVGPDVDDDGRRIEFSVDAFLCVICATEIPLLRAVATRLYHSKETYLTTRDWVQPTIDGSGAKPPEQGMTPKEKRIKEARENTNLFVNIPAARYLLTDDREGRFVSILEVRLGSISITAHGESMVQVGGEASLDLFNADKGWWEPAIEAWHLTASMSRGHSGTRAFVIRSDRRLNVNFTPTTISASMAVAKALKSITTRKKKPESRQILPSEASKMGAPSGDVRRPSIAAFLVRNELGIPVNMSMLKSSRKTTIANNTEVEVGAESESLLTSTSTSDGRSREKALRCLISLVTSAPVEVSASEIGVFPIKFSPFTQTIQTDGRGEGPEAASAVWDVRMIHGVPVCTVRSPLRIGNDTNALLEINVMSRTSGGTTETQSSSERVMRLEPGKFTSISLLDLQSEIMVRPSLRRERLESNTFEWSDPLPDLKQLKRSAYEAARLEHGDRKPPSTMDMRRRRSKRTVVCKSHLNDNCDFYLAIATKTLLRSSPRPLSLATWVDVTLQAPVVLENKLPERLGYRIFRESGAVLAAGLVKALQDVHLHISRDELDSTFVSLAYDNRPRLAGVDDHDSKRVLSDFGTAVSLANLRNGKIVGACTSNYNAASQKRALTLSLLPNVDGSHMTAFAGYWVRNRSDTTIEICSRSSFYGTGSGTHVLRQRPPTVEPDNFVCCEGPYLSVRLPLEDGRRSSDRQDQSGWWTSTTVLYEVNEPVSVVLPGRTLELEVRLAEGLDCPTYIITIRNSTWIVNRTNSPLQWCQASALDAHGNCPTRLLNSLPPGESQALHWEVKASERAVHFRLADSVGQSDWIWSPAVPINIRSSRELPAKMYRPKTHEQYIARVSVKEIAGNCKALVVRREDRQNPPYRIINLCKERAIAFRQTSSQERHWLLRAGKTTRYSWDDPLAPRENRLLSVRVVAPGELISGNPIETGGSSSSQRRPSVHTMFHDLPIDVVGKSTLSSLDAPQNSVNVKIAVDRATKVVTFADGDSDEEPRKTYTLSKAQRRNEGDERSNSVLVVGWEEIKRSPQKERRATTFLNGGMCDYPAVSPAPHTPQSQALSKGNIDIAVFLESVGVSIVDAKPCELIYVWYQSILFNYQSHEGNERYSLSISDLQADNQLCSTSFPVLLSIASNEQSEKGERFNESPGSEHAIVLQVHRDVTNDDILMITSFQADIRPANVYLEDKLVSRAIRFLSDSALGDNFSSIEILSGEDRDYELFKKLTPGDEYSEDDGESYRPGKYRNHAISASRRIYVREFNISSSLLRLTSAGSGSALAKAAGLPVSVRALVGMLLNVENCEFSLAALTVQNEFDSMHHFLVRVRKFYVDQFNKQRMKLLASNSLMGNPAALFDAVGTGARVLMNEPGRAKGSSEFIASVGRGSKSLFAHTVGGIVDSVSGIPRALSSGIEAAVGDKDYLAERQRIRGHTSAGGHRGSAAKTPVQGLATGAVSFAHGISSGVHGFIREPVQGAKQDGARGLLKGIGKAFIGGVAKPVAGGMDFVFEPVAGLSRQIRDAERSNNAHFAAVPDRPPRAFHGRNPRLEVYDRRYALGVYMFETTQIMSRVSYSASLVEWVELSARNGRAEKDSEVWVWEVVRRATRKVPGTKVKNRKGDTPSGQEERGRGGMESRPEKTRVALVTETEVIVTTLDCRLIDVVPLWEEAIYTLRGDGKDLLIRAEMPNHNGSKKQESSASLQGNQPLISAPWDASTVGNRKKPSPGSECTDRIACGSFEARNDLRALLVEVTKSLGTSHDRHRILKKNEEKRSSGVELSCVDDWSNANEKEMRSSDHDEHLATSDISRLNWTLAGKGKGSWTGSRRNEMERTPASLEKTVRRLSMSGLRKSEDSRHDLRMILANKLPSGLMLRLSTSNLEHGVWRIAAADAIEALDAQVIDVGSDMEEGRRGMEVSGVVVYDIVNEFGEIDDERENKGEIGQIVIEFFRGKDEAASFTTRATRGYQAEFVSGGSRHGSAIFTITETAQGQKARLESEGDVSGINSGRRNEAGSSSKATVSGKQNRADGPVPAGDSAGESDSRVGLSDDEMLVQQLVEIGFKFEDAVVALAEAGGDMVKAVDILTK